MSYKSVTGTNQDAQENAGWCLSEQQKVFGVPTTNNGTPVPNATAAWNMAKFRHESRDLPDVPVPVFFSWINRIIGDKHYGENQGHIVGWIPGRGFISSPGSGFGNKWFGSIVEIENYFRCTFVGWTQDLNGKMLAEYVPDAAPAEVAAPVTTGQGGDYHLSVNVPGFVNASDAAAHQNSNSTANAGDYKIFNEANGMVNVTSDVKQPGYWINPSDNVAPAAPQPAPAPAAPAFSVGDTVAPNSIDTTSYEGVAIHAWDASYTITELINDRAVLNARDAVWSSINVANIHKV